MSMGSPLQRATSVMPLPSAFPGHFDLSQLTVCGKDFSTPHEMVCPRGSFTIIRHNKVRDLLASQLTEV